MENHVSGTQFSSLCGVEIYVVEKRKKKEGKLMWRKLRCEKKHREKEMKNETENDEDRLKTIYRT
jgi:hypothetical protein